MQTEQRPIKTRAGWNGSGLDLSHYLQVGDPVDEDMMWYFVEVLPPATYRSTLVQIGEPYSHVKGRETFATLHKREGQWYYSGNCHRGEFWEPKP